MKVYIGPYTNWFGPYQLAEALCFWAKKEKDEHGFDRTPDWVHNFGEWLAHGSVEPDQEVGETRRWGERPYTKLYKFLNWIESKKKRKIKVRIDKYDTWNMDRTLAPIILPMLKQLKATKHGSQIVDLEDVPEHLRGNGTEDYEDQKCFKFYFEDAPDTYVTTHDRWDWVLDEMIWAFEQLQPECDWESQYHTGVSDFVFTAEETKNGGKVYRMGEGENHTSKFDTEGYQKHSARIDKGLLLFGKYFRGLWD